MSSINGSSEERVDSDRVPSYIFEAQPCRNVPGSQPQDGRQPVEVCKPEEAEFWSVYRRKVEHADKPAGKAEWVSDHKTAEEAAGEVSRLVDVEREGKLDEYLEGALTGWLNRDRELPAAEGVFASFWREILMQRSVTVPEWNRCVEDYIKRNPTEQTRIQRRAELTRLLSAPHMTEEAFLLGLNLLGVHKLRLSAEVKNVTGEHQNYVSPHFLVRKLP